MTLSYLYNGSALTHDIAPSTASIESVAEQGASAFSSFQADDPDATLELLGHRPAIIEESACAAQPRLFTGWTTERGVGRVVEAGLHGDETTRGVDVTLVDVNALFNFRLLSGTDAKRPEETWQARLNWLLASDYLDGLIADTGHIITNTSTMDAADYTDAFPAAVMSDLMDRTGGSYNYFAFWDPTAAAVGLFVDHDGHSFSASTLSISNVIADIDSDYCFAPDPAAQLTVTPTETYSEVIVNYAHGTKRLFRSRAATATKYIRRGTTIDRPYTGSAATASKQAEVWLDKHEAEVDRITVTIIVPASRVGLLVAGQSIDVEFSHLTDYTSFTTMHCVRLTVTPTDDLARYYSMTMELLAPGEALVCSFVAAPNYAGWTSLDVFGGAMKGDNQTYDPADPVYATTVSCDGGGWSDFCGQIYGTPNGDALWGIDSHMCDTASSVEARWTWDLSTTGYVNICRIGVKQYAAFSPYLSIEAQLVGESDYFELVAPGVFTTDAFESIAVEPQWIQKLALVYRRTFGPGLTYMNPVAMTCVMAWEIEGGGPDVEVELPPPPGAPITSTSDPTADDDIGDAYQVGQTWINTATGEVFVLVDNTLGAAVWASTTLPALALDDLTDVNAPTPADGDALTWTGAAWVPVHAVTEDDVIALITPDVYACASLTVIGGRGTIAAGAHTDLHAVGGTTVQINEVTGAVGFNVEAAFTGVDGLTNVYCHGYYTATHEVTIDLYNYDTTSWDVAITMPTSQSVMGLLSASIAVGASYFDGGGNAVVRFYHAENGNTSHRLYLDYLAISHATGTTGGLALDDVTDVNAPAPNDGDVLTWDSTPGEWVATAPTGGAVAAEDVTVADAGSHFTTDDVESALAQLATEKVAIVAVFDGGGAEIADNAQVDVRIPFACTLTGWTLLAEPAGAIVIDIWRDTLANYPPSNTEAIPGGGKEPTIAATNAYAEDTSITDWTSDDLVAGDCLRFNVDSCTTIQRATLILTATRT